MDNPILSIYVATYNHEHYIMQALDSILMQQTRYSYEVLVGEDCSTDNTRAVLMEYERQHPGKLTVFYREHNMNRESITNALDLKLRCRGKYIIALEGDDFWTDPHKIEKQISFLEAHPEYIAVAHNCMVVDRDSVPKDETYPECKEEEYTFRHYFSEILPGQLTTVMYRNVFCSREYDISLLKEKLSPGDRVIYFWLLVNGKIRCLQETMSAYRHVTDQGSSYSATYQYRFAVSEALYAALLYYARSVHHEEAVSIAQHLYFRNLMQGVRHRQCSVSHCLNSLKDIDNKLVVFAGYVIYKIRKDITHSQFWI